MASFCDICGKGTQAGCRVSHSNRHSNHTWKPNLQRVHRTNAAGEIVQMNVCTRCIRTENKAQKAK